MEGACLGSVRQRGLAMGGPGKRYKAVHGIEHNSAASGNRDWRHKALLTHLQHPTAQEVC